MKVTSDDAYVHIKLVISPSHMHIVYLMIITQVLIPRPQSRIRFHTFITKRLALIKRKVDSDSQHFILDLFHQTCGIVSFTTAKNKSFHWHHQSLTELDLARSQGIRTEDRVSQ